MRASPVTEPRPLLLLADDDFGPPPDRNEVRTALDLTGGNKSLAARRLGISRRALYRLIDKYGTPPN